MKKHAGSSRPISKASDGAAPLLRLPEWRGAAMEEAPPTFEQQLAHAAMLRRWRREQGLPDDHPPANPKRFTL
jgi:hypothetical protein